MIAEDKKRQPEYHFGSILLKRLPQHNLGIAFARLLLFVWTCRLLLLLLGKEVCGRACSLLCCYRSRFRTCCLQFPALRTSSSFDWECTLYSRLYHSVWFLDRWLSLSRFKTAN